MYLVAETTLYILALRTGYRINSIKRIGFMFFFDISFCGVLSPSGSMTENPLGSKIHTNATTPLNAMQTITVYLITDERQKLKGDKMVAGLFGIA